MADVGKIEYAPDYISKPLLSHPDLSGSLKEDLKWALLTIDWLSNPESSGGITTCSVHKGYGFASDCAICKRIQRLRARDIDL